MRVRSSLMLAAAMLGGTLFMSSYESQAENTATGLRQVVQERLSSAATMEVLGQPKALRQESQDQETLTELTYPETTLMFLQSPHGSTEELVYFKTRRENYRTAEGLAVGASLDEAKNLFPRLQAVEAYLYQQCDRWQRGDCTRLHIQNQRVTHIERMFILD